MRLYFLLVAAMVSFYFALVMWAGPQLAEMTGGLPLFDLRPLGYSPEDASAYLAALPAAGRDFYLQRWFPIDMVFLSVLALFFAVSLPKLYRGRAFVWRAAGVALSVLYVGFDVAENLRVAHLIRAGADGITDIDVSAASLMTTLKFGVFAALILMLIVGVILRLRARLSKT